MYKSIAIIIIFNCMTFAYAEFFDLGCFADDFSSHDLDGFDVVDWEGTNRSTCAKVCTERGFTYAGVQSGDQCYCGNSFGRYCKSTCKTPCSGGASSICGGNMANNILAVNSTSIGNPLINGVISIHISKVTYVLFDYNIISGLYVYGFHAYFVSLHPIGFIIFQVTYSDSSSTTVTLVHKYEYVPKAVGIQFVSLASEKMLIPPNAKFAIQASQMPIAKNIDPNKGTVLYGVFGDLDVGSSYTFISMIPLFKFSIQIVLGPSTSLCPLRITPSTTAQTTKSTTLATTVTTAPTTIQISAPTTLPAPVSTPSPFIPPTADSGNLAFGKNCSFYPGNHETKPPSAVVDGSSVDSWPSCSSSSVASCNNNNPHLNFWQVDLGSNFNISIIEILNRGDDSGSKLDDIAILILSELNENRLASGLYNEDTELCRLVPNVPQGGLQRYNCIKDIIGRYVVILQPRATSCLQICEVRVIGIPVAVQDTYYFDQRRVCSVSELNPTTNITYEICHIAGPPPTLEPLTTYPPVERNESCAFVNNGTYCLQSFGNPIVDGINIDGLFQLVILDYVAPVGQYVCGFEVYLKSSTPIILQLWNHLTTFRYQLVNQVKVEPKLVGAQKHFFRNPTYVGTSDILRIGMIGPGSVVMNHRRDIDDIRYKTIENLQSAPKINEILELSVRLPSYQFSIAMVYAEVPQLCYPYLPPGATTPPPEIPSCVAPQLEPKCPENTRLQCIDSCLIKKSYSTLNTSFSRPIGNEPNDGHLTAPGSYTFVLDFKIPKGFLCGFEYYQKLPGNWTFFVVQSLGNENDFRKFMFTKVVPVVNGQTGRNKVDFDKPFALNGGEKDEMFGFYTQHDPFIPYTFVPFTDVVWYAGASHHGDKKPIADTTFKTPSKVIVYRFSLRVIYAPRADACKSSYNHVTEKMWKSACDADNACPGDKTAVCVTDSTLCDTCNTCDQCSSFGINVLNTTEAFAAPMCPKAPTMAYQPVSFNDTCIIYADRTECTKIIGNPLKADLVFKGRFSFILDDYLLPKDYYITSFGAAFNHLSTVTIMVVESYSEEHLSYQDYKVLAAIEFTASFIGNNTITLPEPMKLKGTEKIGFYVNGNFTIGLVVSKYISVTWYNNADDPVKGAVIRYPLKRAGLKFALQVTVTPDPRLGTNDGIPTVAPPPPTSPAPPARCNIDVVKPTCAVDKFSTYGSFNFGLEEDELASKKPLDNVGPLYPPITESPKSKALLIGNSFAGEMSSQNVGVYLNLKDELPATYYLCHFIAYFPKPTMIEIQLWTETESGKFVLKNSIPYMAKESGFEKIIPDNPIYLNSNYFLGFRSFIEHTIPFRESKSTEAIFKHIKPLTEIKEGYLISDFEKVLGLEWSLQGLITTDRKSCISKPK